ncbi:uncharacterized protein LOC121428127 [Lytechinus variegatus]|uniref:uncharacterized protein LOC121428127 n=1 Tax=Lytechinus variegatus TaxID=7654 RepID=UPI001BB2A145|nr:uncharacterized protein LOC121428127 [Lytechinus variegatus]
MVSRGKIMDVVRMTHATFYCSDTKLIYLAVNLQILLYCRFVNAASIETRIGQCVLPSESGVKVWSLCTKQMIDACQPGMYQSDNCSISQASCKSCSRGSFTPGWNNCSVCFQCSTCEFGIEEDCSADRDTRCKLVPDEPEKIQVTSTGPLLRNGTKSSETAIFESQNPVKSVPLKNVTNPELASGCDCGIQIDVAHVPAYVVLILIILFLLPGNALYIRDRRRKACDRLQEEDFKAVTPQHAQHEEIPLRSDDNNVHDIDEMQAG